MKQVCHSVGENRYLACFSLCCLILLTCTESFGKGTYFDTRGLLKSFFTTSKKVTYVEISGQALAKAMGHGVPREKYVVFVAQSGASIDGFAVIDEEKGQHLPITFGVKLNPDSSVAAFEVMVYREGYGDEIREKRFRRQFLNMGLGDKIRLGRDVDAISGATISSNSSAIAVRRAVALSNLARKKHRKRELSSVPTPQAASSTP